MKYWPYMHDPDVKECMETISKDSWSKISQIGAIRISASLSLLALLFVY
jgi:hypothetical protein